MPSRSFIIYNFPEELEVKLSGKLNTPCSICHISIDTAEYAAAES